MKVCPVILFNNKQSVLEDITCLQDKDYDFVELRLDYYEDIDDRNKVIDLLKDVKHLLNKPVLTTIRSYNEGGNRLIEDEYYYSLYKDIINNHLTDYIDLELSKDKIHNFEMIDYAHSHHIKVIMSYHNFNETLDNDILKSYVEEMEIMGADIAKIAVMPRCKEDVVNVINLNILLSSYMNIPVTIISMGELGTITRVLGPMMGSYMTYVTIHNSAIGQIHIDDIKKYKEIYHD